MIEILLNTFFIILAIRELWINPLFTGYVDGTLKFNWHSFMWLILGILFVVLLVAKLTSKEFVL